MTESEANREPEVNPEKVQEFAGRVMSSAQQGMNCALSFVGDQLGLYRGLQELGQATSEKLATHTGLHERWVREWLYQQACAEQIEYDEVQDTFSITPEAALVLVEQDHPAFLAGLFESVVALYQSVDELPESFRTGLGQSYEAKGEACACGIERMSRQFQTQQLVPHLLPKLDGVVERLEAGVRVADVGCGSATSTVAMAAAFPNSTFIGYDNSQTALARAREKIAESGLGNVTLLDPTDDPLPQDGSFDLVTTFDVIHDSTHPKELIDAIRGALPEDGTWLCADIKGLPSFAENLQSNPIAPVAYCFSLLVCMSSGLSVPDGAGLGTLGFHEQKAREMTGGAGFSRFRTIEYEGDVLNAFYEIRP